MRINNVILENELTNKFLNMTFQSIVTEAFIGSIPFKKSLDDNDAVSLINYSKSVLESAGGISILYDALERENDLFKKSYLNQVMEACAKTSKKAAKRVANENKDADTDDAPMNDIIKKASLTKEEYDEFIKDKKNLSLERINEIISNKVLEVIKAEKEAYEKNEELKSELNEKIANETSKKEDKELDDKKDEEKDEDAVEALLKTSLGNSIAYEHVSFFSSIQKNMALSIIQEATSYDELPINSITDVTINNTIDVFASTPKSPIDALEAAINLEKRSVDVSSENINDIMDLAFESAVIVYTMMESLSTLNLISVSQKDIQGVIESSMASISDRVNDLQTNAVARIAKNIENVRKTIICENDLSALIDIDEDLTEFTEKMNSLGKSDICTEAVADVATLLKNKITALESTSVEPMTHQDAHVRETNIVAINKLAKIPALKFNSNKLRIEVPTEEAFEGYINAKVISPLGDIVTESFVMLEDESTNISKTDYVKILASQSKLASMNNPMSILTLDGTGREANLL